MIGDVSVGVDDAESECGLDIGWTFDAFVENNGDEPTLEQQLAQLLKTVTGRIS